MSFRDKRNRASRIPDNLSEVLTTNICAEYFEEVCQKLLNLDITIGRPHMFSGYVNDNWTKIAAIERGVHIGDRTEAIPGQRIIVNRYSRDEATSLERVSIHDYLVCYENGSIMCVNSKLNMVHGDQPGDFRWSIPANGGPIVKQEGSEIQVLMGKDYDTRIFCESVLQSTAAVAMQQLLQDLHGVTESWRDDIEGYTVKATFGQ